jgi:hypothetical protein
VDAEVGRGTQDNGLRLSNFLIIWIQGVLELAMIVRCTEVGAPETWTEVEIVQVHKLRLCAASLQKRVDHPIHVTLSHRTAAEA